MNNVFRKVASGFVKNLSTIIQALIFSVVIWFFISIQIFPDVTMRISGIEVIYEPTPFMNEEDLHITGIDTADVTIQIEGKRYSISELTADDFTAVCDLSGIYESGEHSVPINIAPSDRNTNVNCQILTNSLTAKVTVVKIVTREIEVIPNTNSLTIAEGMQIEGDVTVEPPTVIVMGEERLVNSIGQAQAIASSDEALERSESLKAELTFFNNSGVKIASPDLRYDNTDFSVNIPVYKVRTLPVKVKFTGSSGGANSFDAESLDYLMSINEITIASPDSSIDNLEAIDIGEISLTSLTLKDLQGGVTLPVELPEGYKNISGNRTITVTFPEYEEFGQLGFTVPSENFTIINRPRDYDIKLLTNELTVNVVGYSNYIASMTAADIYATINLLGVELNEGYKTASVTFRLTGSNVKAWVTGEEYKVELLVTPNANTQE